MRGGWSRLRAGEGLPGFLQAGSEFRRWAGLTLRSWRTVWGVGLAVAGTAVTGAGLGLLVHGTGVRTLDIAGPEAEALSSGLVTALLGTFLLGLAVESGLRASDHVEGTKAWESAAATAVGLVVFAPVAGFLARVRPAPGFFLRSPLRWRERPPALLYAAWLAGFIWLYRPPSNPPARLRPTVLCRGVTG